MERRRQPAAIPGGRRRWAGREEETRNVVANRPAVEAGLSVLDAGGDFADGAIAYEGAWLGAETFVSFDKKAVCLLNRQGRRATLLT